MSKIIGAVDLSSHGVFQWQKKENSRLASRAAKKKAADDRHRREKNRRESADKACFEQALAAYRRQIVRQNGGKKLTRAEKCQLRQDFLAKWN